MDRTAIKAYRIGRLGEAIIVWVRIPGLSTQDYSMDSIVYLGLFSHFLIGIISPDPGPKDPFPYVPKLLSYPTMKKIFAVVAAACLGMAQLFYANSHKPPKITQAEFTGGPAVSAHPERIDHQSGYSHFHLLAPAMSPLQGLR